MASSGLFDHYAQLYEIVRHHLSYMQLYNTQHANSMLRNRILWCTAYNLSRNLSPIENSIGDSEIWTPDLPSTSQTRYQLNVKTINWAVLCHLNRFYTGEPHTAPPSHVKPQQPTIHLAINCIFYLNLLTNELHWRKWSGIPKKLPDKTLMFTQTFHLVCFHNLYLTLEKLFKHFHFKLKWWNGMLRHSLATLKGE